MHKYPWEWPELVTSLLEIGAGERGGGCFSLLMTEQNLSVIPELPYYSIEMPSWLPGGIGAPHPQRGAGARRRAPGYFQAACPSQGKLQHGKWWEKRPQVTSNFSPLPAPRRIRFLKSHREEMCSKGVGAKGNSKHTRSESN